MSAIFGVVRFDDRPLAQKEVDRMGRTMAHRAVDGQHVTVLGRAGFGHGLMRVNREDYHEAQPVHDGPLLLTADLRLDNRTALASALGIGDATLAELPDSALLLAAHQRWGEACVDHLLGDFAFAIYDARAQTLLLARDPMGQRGVYYHLGPDFCAFASEAKALWAIEGVPRVLSEDGIGRRLLFPLDVTPGATMFEGIAVVPAGTLVRIMADGSATTRRYWEPRADPAHLGHDEAYYVAQYRAVLGAAVACRVERLIHSPALLLSGGFDSGGIAVLAEPIVGAREQRLIAVTSVLPEGEKRVVRDARAAAEAFRGRPGLDLHHYVRGDESVLTDLTATFAATSDTLGTSYARRGMYRIARKAGARLVLDGMGGDYTLNVRTGARVGQLLRLGEFRRFVREARARRRATGHSWLSVARFDVVPALLPLGVLRAREWIRRGFTPQWRARLAAEPFARALVGRGAIDPARVRGAMPVHNRWRARDLHLLNKSALAEPAQATLAATEGLEFSRPFHDRRVVELALAIPEQFHLRDGKERNLARQALGDLLPPALLARVGGNDQEEPDMFRMAQVAAPTALADVRALDRDGRLSRYVDLDRLERSIADIRETRLADHRRLVVALRALTLARFIAWFEQRNARAPDDTLPQEP